jgi:hypothetical protein
MSATDAATYPKGATLLAINNPSKGAKISPSTHNNYPLTPVVTAVLNEM